MASALMPQVHLASRRCQVAVLETQLRVALIQWRWGDARVPLAGMTCETKPRHLSDVSPFRRGLCRRVATPGFAPFGRAGVERFWRCPETVFSASATCGLKLEPVSGAESSPTHYHAVRHGTTRLNRRHTGSVGPDRCKSDTALERDIPTIVRRNGTQTRRTL